MSNIKAIDKFTVHRICSGQVVLNLAIAVKELVENSLDAGATVIDVRLKEYGFDLIEVSDNGSGVHPSNFEGLTRKHHTSKLREFSDLISVETFGFRGEALSSLCAVSELVILTRHESQSCGHKITYDTSGTIVEQTSHARQIGTTVTVKNIFYTLPVRQKEFTRNIKKEFNKMSQLLSAYCLVATGVRINCVNEARKGGRMVFLSTSGCLSLKENISCVFGAKQLNNLLEIKHVNPPIEVLEELKVKLDECDIFKISGFISSCAHGCGRSTNDRQFYYINSRPCEPNKVMKIVNEIYHQYNVNQQPFVCLNMEVAKGSVDINVTPDKRQIFLTQEKVMLEIIKASLLDIFKKIPSTFAVNQIPSRGVVKSFERDISSKPNLSQFSAWRHKNDGKRSLDSSTSDDVPKKQIKIESAAQKTLDLFNITRNPLKTGSQEEVTESFPNSEEVKQSVENVESVNCNHSISDDGLSQVSENINGICDSEANTSRSIYANICYSKLDKDAKSNDLSHCGNEDRSNLSESSVVEHENIEQQMCNEDQPDILVVDPDINISPFNKLENNNSDDTHEDAMVENVCDISDKCRKHKNSNSVAKNKMFRTIESVKDTSNTSVIYDEFEERGVKHISVPLNLDSIKSAIKKRSSCKDLESKINQTLVRFKANIDPSKNEQAESELSKEISKEMFKKMDIIGQFNLGFIIVKLGSDLFIVDQHATDEKYNFETLQRTTVISNQKLVNPQTLELTAANECILMDNVEIFRRNGFEFDINEEGPPTKRIKLTAIPMSKNWIFGKDDIDELIFMLEDSPGADCRPSRVRAMFASRACRKSVMIGTALSMQDMKRLINNMGTIEQPWNCPHGRPTMRHLVNLDLICKPK